MMEKGGVWKNTSFHRPGQVNDGWQKKERRGKYARGFPDLRGGKILGGVWTDPEEATRRGPRSVQRMAGGEFDARKYTKKKRKELG